MVEEPPKKLAVHRGVWSTPPVLGTGNRWFESSCADNQYHKFIFSLGGNCQYCGRECKFKHVLNYHERRCFKNPNRIEYIVLYQKTFGLNVKKKYYLVVLI